MKVAFIYSQLLDANGEKQHVGGVETYLIHLANLCFEMGWSPILFQKGNKYFERELGKLKVIGIPVATQKFHIIKKKLYNAALKEIDIAKDIVIFGGDHHSIPIKNKRCISIQHGVLWDLPNIYLTNKKIIHRGFAGILYKLRLSLLYYSIFNYCHYRVCVDYNFVNWYKTIHPLSTFNGKIWVITNFTTLASAEQIKNRNFTNKEIRIIFARRFVPYRGTRLIVEVAQNILNRYPNVSFTFAGEGQDEEWMKNYFNKNGRVKFIKYFPQESIDIYFAHDIVVVPSIASEGTSFSVAEAMGAGCVVITTAIGGITNMIINEFNGILAMPTVESLTTGVEKVLNNIPLRKKLSRNAYETAKSAFSIESWKEKWREVLLEVANAK